MAGTLGKFQTVGFTSWKGLTKENHLGAIFGLAPQKATNLMVQLLAAHYGKTLDTFLSQFPTKEFEDDSEYYWEVIGSSRRNIPLVEARDENMNPVTKESGILLALVLLLSILYSLRTGSQTVDYLLSQFSNKLKLN